MYKQESTNIFSPASQQSWMPIDTESHWTIKNPLNVFIVLPIVLLVFSLVMA
ncbi:hypothetical protein [Herpetosiphon giganteus]|uniref:hypothetical protein n=1 Tax=Herpetosiphon giganteus TaxID=2029754 RepID=UPI00195AD856|nr:hypothetical protein [Herpetosiphon giganteus]MBM7844254.1 hypothetical protein [Herpetosiphon giganteus]